MSKANQAAKAAKNNGGGPEWPVSKPEDLTIDHVPSKLQAQIRAQAEEDAKNIALALVDVMDRRNDTVTGFDRIQKEARKDSRAINEHMAQPRVLEALKRTGIMRDAERANVD